MFVEGQFTYECPERQIGKEQPGDAANDNTNKHRRCQKSEYKLSLCEAKEHILYNREWEDVLLHLYNTRKYESHAQ